MEIPNEVTRRTLLRSAALGTVALASGVDNVFGQRVSGPPNIVFIMADDLGYADVSCYGRPDISTPNIDGLAAKGVRFLQAYANSAVCSATRTALITGRYKTGCQSGWRSRWPAAMSAYHRIFLPSVPVEEGWLRNDACREVASGCAPEIWSSPERLRPFLRIPRRRCRLLYAFIPKRRFMGRRCAGASDGLPDGYARWPCRGRHQWVCEIRPPVSDKSAFQRAALAVGSTW